MTNVKGKILATVFSAILVLLGAFVIIYSFLLKPKAGDVKTNSVNSINSITYNELTGLPMEQSKLNLRPVFVMTNNVHKRSDPQNLNGAFGIGEADILYQMELEGGSTRLMQVYKDISTAPNLGNLRSARLPFIDIANGYNGIYVHLGGSFNAKEAFFQNVIDHIDFITEGPFMWRDANRRKNLGLEYSAFTSGEKLVKAIQNKGFRETLPQGYNPKANFSDDSPVLNGKEAKKFNVKFSGVKHTIFEYDETQKKYLLSQKHEGSNDIKPMLDRNTEQVVAKDNIIILRCETSNVGNTELLDIKTTEEGVGYYVSHGKLINIKWQRPNTSSPFVYTCQDGTPLPLLKGKFFICVIRPNAAVIIE